MEEELVKLRDGLKEYVPGNRKKIASKAGCSAATVNNVLMGTSKDTKYNIIGIAVEMLKEAIERQNDNMEKLKEIVNQ
ncbi:hypothetical protein [Limibacterium fermenti]|uniref:hypothetical protein n=1 Tax=Limibacterium fermenti TaxID=3229863 RepID=UPI003A72EC1A